MSFLQSNNKSNLIINIGAFIVLVLLLVFVFGFYLKIYTHHGESLTVPDFKGETIEKAKADCKEHNLQFIVKDSVYDFDKPKLSIIEQNPKPGSKVKEGRRVYFTINMDKAPQVEFSARELVGEIRDQALRMLVGKGLREGRISYKPDMALNLVLGVMYNGRMVTDGNIKVDKGSMIDLVLGDGGKNQEATVPNVVGHPLYEGIIFVKDANLNYGQPIRDPDTTMFKDSIKAIIYKQSPLAGSIVPMGEPVFLWITPPNRFNRLYAKKPNPNAATQGGPLKNGK